jgi:aryl-alcohol dehydrogenase-like predicted oxidoreductase
VTAATRTITPDEHRGAMKARPLGRTRLLVSEVGFGTLGLGGDVYGPVEDETSRAAILRAADLGCRLFDTADVYGAGRSEQLLGETLAGRPDVLVATKAGKAGAGTLAPARLRAALSGSLGRLRRAAIDLFQIHDPPFATLLDPSIHELMSELRRERVIRAAGVSVIAPADGVEAVLCGAWDVVQVQASLVAPEATRRLFPLAAERGVGILVRVPLAHGILAGRHGRDTRFAPGDVRGQAPPAVVEHFCRLVERLRFLAEGTGRTLAQAAIRYLLDQPGVSSVLVGIKSSAQAEEAMAASGVAPLTSDEMAEILRVQADVAS